MNNRPTLRLFDWQTRESSDLTRNNDKSSIEHTKEYEFNRTSKSAEQNLESDPVFNMIQGVSVPLRCPLSDAILLSYGTDTESKT